MTTKKQMDILHNKVESVANDCSSMVRLEEFNRAMSSKDTPMDAAIYTQLKAILVKLEEIERYVNIVRM